MTRLNRLWSLSPVAVNKVSLNHSDRGTFGTKMKSAKLIKSGIRCEIPKLRFHQSHQFSGMYI